MAQNLTLLGFGDGQHGQEMHFVRPDRVYRTAVLTSIPGYHPVSNAHAIAARFTTPHYYATRLPSAPVGLSGYGFGALPLWSRIKLAMSGYFARKKAARLMARAGAVSGWGLGGFGQLPPGIARGEPMMASDLPPGITRRVPMLYPTNVPYDPLVALQPTHGPGEYGVLAANTQMAEMALAIVAGLPPETTRPNVAEPQIEAAGRIAPNYAMIPSQQAAKVNDYASGRIAWAAYRRGIGFFNAVRMWWFG